MNVCACYLKADSRMLSISSSKLNEDREQRDTKRQMQPLHSFSRSKNLITHECAIYLDFSVHDKRTHITPGMNLCTYVYAAVHRESYKILLSVKSKRDCNA